MMARSQLYQASDLLRPKRRPKNPQHKKYLENERRIHREIHRAIRARTMNLTARDVYQSAGITPPTFYLHCRNSTDAKRRYETQIEEELYARVPVRARKVFVLNCLGAHVVQNRQYFYSVLIGYDNYLLRKIILHYRLSLVGGKVSNPAFVHYMCELEAIIFCWGKYDHFSKQKLDDYVGKMLRVRPRRV